MHQYTADLANRMTAYARGAEGEKDRHDPRIADSRPSVHLITTANYPAGRYGPGVEIHTPLTATGTGFGREGLDVAACWRVLASVEALARKEGERENPGERESERGRGGETPTFDPGPGTPVVHFTGVHLWNPLLLAVLRRQGVRTVHTLHDLDPHHGVRFGSFIRLWNRLVIRGADHLLVHGEVYRRRLLASGVPAERVTCTPLLHGFWGLADGEGEGERGRPGEWQTWDQEDQAPHDSISDRTSPLVLFFGRVEAYKGVEVLVEAWRRLVQGEAGTSASWIGDARLIVAGPVADEVRPRLSALPPGVNLLDRRIMDEEGIALFRRASLVVLPYIDATQSAVIASAYYFNKPVLVTRTGALPEYVEEDVTGKVVPRADAAALAVALDEMLFDPQRLQAMGLAGRQWYDTQRTRELATLQSMYNRLATRHST